MSPSKYISIKNTAAKIIIGIGLLLFLISHYNIYIQKKELNVTHMSEMPYGMLERIHDMFQGFLVNEIIKSAIVNFYYKYHYHSSNSNKRSIK